MNSSRSESLPPWNRMVPRLSPEGVIRQHAAFIGNPIPVNGAALGAEKVGKIGIEQFLGPVIDISALRRVRHHKKLCHTEVTRRRGPVLPPFCLIG